MEKPTPGQLRIEHKPEKESSDLLFPGSFDHEIMILHLKFVLKCIIN